MALQLEKGGKREKEKKEEGKRGGGLVLHTLHLKAVLIWAYLCECRGRGGGEEKKRKGWGKITRDPLAGFFVTDCTMWPEGEGGGKEKRKTQSSVACIPCHHLGERRGKKRGKRIAFCGRMASVEVDEKKWKGGKKGGKAGGSGFFSYAV